MDGSGESAAVDVIGGAIAALPMLAVIVLSVVVIWGVDRWFARRPRSLGRPAMMAGLTVVAVIAVALSAPIDGETRGQLFGLFGLAFTAVIALASTTFVSNAMAGLMLRSLRNFAPGDFIRVEGHFGRVTERGLFHTEIQTEDRDLTTIPNLLLATKPTSVVRASGTIIAARVSLGYDAPRDRIETALKNGAVAAGLEEPFVQVVDLGDYAVTYRVAGFLTKVKHLVSARSRLRAKAMDALHTAGIEIVSPTFMNQRRVDGEPIAPPHAQSPARERPEAEPERVMFDKADAAERLAQAEKALDEVRVQQKDSASKDNLNELRVAEQRLQRQIEVLRERAAEER